MRGAGDFFGSRQHGLPSLGIADLVEDTALFRQAKQAAEAIKKEDPSLQKPENSKIKAKILEIFGDHDNGLN